MGLTLPTGEIQSKRFINLTGETVNLKKTRQTTRIVFFLTELRSF